LVAREPVEDLPESGQAGVDAVAAHGFGRSASGR
jgi:hypothetical protein